MFYQLAINFCILFTFSVLSYWPFQDRTRFRIPHALHPYLIGITSGITGLFLLSAAVQVADGVIVDARMSVIVISGLFGGPVAPFISSAIIGVARMLGGEFSTSAIIAGSNTILIGLVSFAVFAGRRKSFREARIIFHFVTLETALILALLLAPGSDWFTNVMLYIPFSYLSFFTVAFILSELDGHFQKLKGIERQSKTDYLTQLNNSRMFGELSGWMIGSGRLVSLVLLDIDHFKKVNDTYGHPVGDEVLRELANRMRNTPLPDGAILSRNGGEEFSVLLPGIGRKEAAEAAEHLRDAIGSRPFRLDDALSIPVTISLGVCTYPDDAADSKELYDRADAALYHAKNSGRNRTVSWTEGSHVSSGSMELAYDQTMKR